MNELKIYAISIEELDLLRKAMTGGILSDADLERVRSESFGRHDAPESDDFVRIDYFKVQAVRAHIEEEIRLVDSVGAGDVSVEQTRFADYLVTMGDHLAASLARDYAEHAQRVAARRQRTKKAKQLDPAYQKAADILRKNYIGFKPLSKRKLAQQVHDEVAAAILKNQVKIDKIASVETIRKHIK